MAGSYQKPRATESEQLRNRFNNLRRSFPNGTDLLEEASRTLHSRSIQERESEEGKSVKTIFDPNNKAHVEIQSLMKNPQSWLDAEKHLDIKLGLNGSISVATCCSMAECQRVECPCRM